MITTAVRIEITCPNWCSISPEEHVANLWEMEGCCVHHSSIVSVKDTEGYSEPMRETIYRAPIELSCTSTTRPDGREQASRVFFLDDRELSIQQARDLAETMLRMLGEVGES